MDRDSAQLHAGVFTADRHLLLEHSADRLVAHAQPSARDRIVRVINATGVILHTGLGRSALA